MSVPPVPVPSAGSTRPARASSSRGSGSADEFQAMFDQHVAAGREHARSTASERREAHGSRPEGPAEGRGDDTGAPDAGAPGADDRPSATAAVSATAVPPPPCGVVTDPAAAVGAVMPGAAGQVPAVTTGGSAAPASSDVGSAAASGGVVTGQPTPTGPGAPAVNAATTATPTAGPVAGEPAGAAVGDTQPMPGASAKGSAAATAQARHGHDASPQVTAAPVPAGNGHDPSDTASPGGAGPDPATETETAQGSPARPADASARPADGSVGTAPVAAPAAAQAGPAQAAGQPSPPGAHGHHTAVLDQVLPVVPRLVARGDGTQRLTLKLHPEDLGEVHLTVTVRKNTVDVTLAAGSAAQDALRDGSSHLRALLDAAGHTTGQVVVRDLPQSASPGQAQPNGGQGGPGQGGAGQGGASPQAFADGSGARGQQSTQGQGRPGTPRQPVAGDPGGTAPTPRSVGTPGTTTLDLRI